MRRHRACWMACSSTMRWSPRAMPTTCGQALTRIYLRRCATPLALRAPGTRPRRLESTGVGGWAVPPSMSGAFRDEFGVEWMHAWGMTETSPLGTLNQPLARHIHLDPQRQSELRLGQGRPTYGVQ